METHLKTCPVCLGRFMPKTTGVIQIYCSRPCRTKAYEQQRNMTPSEPLCRACRKPLEPATGSRPRSYCNQACRTEGWRLRHATVEIVCDQCGKLVRRSPTSVDHAEKNHFCSTRCKGKWMSANLLGEKHPNWKGDKLSYLSGIIRRHSRGKEWAAAVLANAEGLCERCGSSAKDAHHKREVAELLAMILDPANGEALCKSCHIAHHSVIPFA